MKLLWMREIVCYCDNPLIWNKSDFEKYVKDNKLDGCILTHSGLHPHTLNSTKMAFLKTNGILLAREPLGTNPLFSLYRLMTPKARTPDERPFTFSDLKLLEKYFEFKSVEYFGFLSVFSAFLKLDLVRNVLTKIDYVFSLTPVKYLFWQFAGEFKKKS